MPHSVMHLVCTSMHCLSTHLICYIHVRTLGTVVWQGSFYSEEGERGERREEREREEGGELIFTIVKPWNVLIKRAVHTYSESDISLSLYTPHVLDSVIGFQQYQVNLI